MSSPPLLFGADQLTVICVPLLEPETDVGAPGTVAGIRWPLATADAALDPALFVAFTVNV